MWVVNTLEPELERWIEVGSKKGVAVWGEPIRFLFVNKTLASLSVSVKNMKKNSCLQSCSASLKKAATEEATDYGTANYCITQFPEPETFERKSLQTDV
jgi:hypothetical protein